MVSIGQSTGATDGGCLLGTRGAQGLLHRQLLSTAFTVKDFKTTLANGIIVVAGPFPSHTSLGICKVSSNGYLCF